VKQDIRQTTTPVIQQSGMSGTLMSMEPRAKTVHGDEDRVPMLCFAYVHLGANALLILAKHLPFPRQRIDAETDALPGIRVVSLSHINDSALPGGRLQSMTSREYVCRIRKAASRAASFTATAAAPISQAMWRRRSSVDTPSEFSLRGTSAPAWSQAKKNDDRPSFPKGSGLIGCQQ